MMNFTGKRVSIMGDSISTLYGYIPKGYNVYYCEMLASVSNVRTPADTWWGKVIERLGGELLINNSWSGSWVSKLPDREELFPSGCSDERTSGLHNGDVMPDAIIIYMGTNDWLFGALPESSSDIQRLKDQSFKYAYNNMLKKLKSNYPSAEIWCCTLSDSDFCDFPYGNSFGIKPYCDIIIDAAGKNGCNVIDIYSHHTMYSSIDGLHPSAEGMETLAQIITQEIMEK